MGPPQPEAEAAQFFWVQWAQNFLTVSIAENGGGANSFNQKNIFLNSRGSRGSSNGAYDSTGVAVNSHGRIGSLRTKRSSSQFNPLKSRACDDKFLLRLHLLLWTSWAIHHFNRFWYLTRTLHGLALLPNVCFTVFTPPQVLSLHLPLESSSKCRVSLKNPKDIMSWSSQHSSTRDIERCRGTTDDFRWSKFRGADVDVTVGPSIANDTLPGGLKNPVVNNNSPFTPRIFRAEKNPSDTPIYLYIF